MSEQYIGKYRVEERVGSGTFASVFRCYDPDLDRICAIKVLADNWSEDERARSWFLNEARVMFGIEHPSILRIFTSDTLEDGRPYFVMEYAGAGSLADLIRDRRARGERFSTAEALDIGIAIADGLDVAHNRGLVHRDLKPSNILFVGSSADLDAEPPSHDLAHFQVKLADFGLARRFEEGAHSLAGAGTPHYIAPEQAQGFAEERPDVRSDIYSAATILYEMLAGQVPFPYESMTQVVAAHLDQDPRPIRELSPDVPSEVATAVHAGLAKNLEHRIPTALAWRYQLQVLRAALNPDGSISGWEHRDENAQDEPEAAPMPVIPFAQTGDSAQTPVDDRQVPDVEGIPSTRIKRNDGVGEVHPDQVDEEPRRNPDRSNRMASYIAVALVAGLLTVGLLGYALADLISEHERAESGEQAPVAEIAAPTETESEATEEPDTRVTPTEEEVEPSPEPEPDPTPTPEPTEEPEDEPSVEYIAGSLQQLPATSSSSVILPSGEQVGSASERELAAASTIKLWVAATAYEDAAQGDLELQEERTIGADDQASGTGILNGGQFVGETFTYGEILEIMLLYSDNTAANIIVDRLGGFERVNEYADEHEYRETRMQRWLGDLDPDRENYTSARDGALFMERLLDGEIVDEDTSSTLRAILEQRAENETNEGNVFGRDLPEDVRYAHIAGLLPGARNEFGYFYHEERGGYAVVSLMLSELADEPGAETAMSGVVGDIHFQLAEVAMQ